MSAPAVKPVLSAPAAGGQTPTPTATSPLKNHSGSPNLSITLVNDKTPEKPKDAVSSNASPKSTPNGVEAAKSGSPLVNDKKSDDSNHITSTTATTPQVNNVTQITASPLKATPEKTQPANNTPPASANNTTPKSTTPTTTPGPTATAVSTPPPSAVGSTTAAASDKQATPTKANSTPSDDKEKLTQTTTSPTTPKRGAEKTDKQEKDKEKAGTASRIKRKRETAPPSTPSSEDADSKGSKRTRVPVQPYQSPMPDLFPTKVKTPAKPPVVKEEKEKDTDKEKLVIFYKNEFLAVRNSEGSFYVCQAMQNVYKSSHKIKIRWLSQVEGEKSDDGTVYSPDFYDTTDFDCILTSLSLKRVDKSKFNLSTDETLRTENILKRALDVEKGVSEKPELTEEHPDGLDLSLFKDEAQLKKRKSQGKRASGSPKRARRSQSPVKKEEKPKVEKKKPVVTPKRTPARKAASPKLAGRKARSVSVGKTPRKDKEDKPEKIEKQTAQTRAERASEREKAKEGTPASKTPAKRKADSPVPPVETKAPKTTARTAASAKKAAAEAKAAAQAAIAAQSATASASPAGRKPPARGRRGLGNAESSEPEVAAPQNRATKRNVRSSSPTDTEKKESTEVTKDEVEAKSAEAADTPASTTSATPVSETTPATTSPVVPAVAPPATPAAAPADSAAAPSDQKVQAPAETATSAASTESTTASEAKSPSSDASPNRGAPKKSTTPSPPKKA